MLLELINSLLSSRKWYFWRCGEVEWTEIVNILMERTRGIASRAGNYEYAPEMCKIGRKRNASTLSNYEICFSTNRLWGPFLESPETFWAHFGRHNSLCIFKTKESRGTKLPLQHMKKLILQNKRVGVLRMTSALRERTVWSFATL